MSITLKLKMDDLIVEIRENGVTINVLAPEPDDHRPCWQSVVLTTEQLSLAIKFINDNMEIK